MKKGPFFGSSRINPYAVRVSRETCLLLIGIVFLATLFPNLTYANPPGSAPISVASSDRSIVLDFDNRGNVSAISLQSQSVPLTGAGSDVLAFRTPSQPADSLSGRLLPVSRAMKFPSGTLDYSEDNALARVSLSYGAHSNYISVDGKVDGSSFDLPFQATYTLPINAAGWTWYDDLRSTRTIGDNKSYSNVATAASERTSVYPIGTIANGKVAVTLAVPLDAPRIVRIAYVPGAGLKITFDLGTSPKAQMLNAAATFSFIIYASDPTWGMRDALAKYYSIFPQLFTRRTTADKEGIWHVGMAQALRNGQPDAAFATDYGLGLNQVTFGEVLYRGRGYYSTAARVTWNNALGVMTGNHANFWYFKFKPEGDPAKLSYDEVVDQLKRAAEKKPSTGDASDDAHKLYSEARAALNSTARDSAGRLVFFVYGDMIAFVQNNETQGPGPTWSEVAVKYQLDRAVAMASSSKGHLSAFLMDGVSGINRGMKVVGWNAVYDYDHGHWAAATIPLTYDHEDRKHRVAVLTAFPNYIGLRNFAREARQRQLIVAANMVADLNRPAGWFGADLVDYWGIEGSLAERATRSKASVDSFASWKRALAYQRPISTLEHFPNDKSPEQFEQTLAQNLFYDIYPGGISSFKATWLTDSSVRALYAKYIPMFRALAKAGWEPVQYSTSSNPKLWLERYGSLARGEMYLAVRNETDTTQGGTLTLLEQPGVKDLSRMSAHDLQSGTLIPVVARENVRTLAITLPARSTRVLKIATSDSRERAPK